MWLIRRPKYGTTREGVEKATFSSCNQMTATNEDNNTKVTNIIVYGDDMRMVVAT